MQNCGLDNGFWLLPEVNQYVQEPTDPFKLLRGGLFLEHILRDGVVNPDLELLRVHHPTEGFGLVLVLLEGYFGF